MDMTVPSKGSRVTVDDFVSACVRAMEIKRLRISDLLRNPKALSGAFNMISHKLDLGLKKEEAKEHLGQFWHQNKAKLVPLIAELMGEPVPEQYKDSTKSEQQDVSASEQTQGKDAIQMPQNRSLDAANGSETAADNLTENRHEVLTETNQKLSDNIARTITPTELEETIQNLRTEINTELERRHKEFGNWQFWITKEIEFIKERIQKLSDPSSYLHEPDDYQLSPEPARAGKSHLVKRSKIWGTLDTELEYLLKKEAKRKGVTFSRILDCAIWNFLKKPPLSFQKKTRMTRINKPPLSFQTNQPRFEERKRSQR